MSEVRIRRGKILVYRFFEVGSEIDLKKASLLMQQKQNTSRFRLDRPSKTSLVIADAPLTVHLGANELNLQGVQTSVELDISLWHFGGMSLCFHIPIRPGLYWSELVQLASWLDRDQEIEIAARTKAREFQQEIKDCIPVLNDWPGFEDYVVYFLQEVEGLETSAMELFEKADVPALILAEPKEQLSEQTKKSIRDYATQYSKDDLSVIDWNSALVVEPSGSMDLPMVLEFANSQLLEMRYYDDLLDEKLDALYKSSVGKKPGILSNIYSHHAEEAGQIYLEIAEVVENVQNSLKVVGDFYLATVFRTASARFRFSDWQKSIDEKLGNLAEVSKLLHSRVSESRSHLLEIIIIVLIAIEVVPFVYGLLR
jgi:hypothetical protein